MMQHIILAASGDQATEPGLWEDAHGHALVVMAGVVFPLCPENGEPTVWFSRSTTISGTLPR